MMANSQKVHWVTPGFHLTIGGESTNAGYASRGFSNLANERLVAVRMVAVPPIFLFLPL